MDMFRTPGGNLVGLEKSQFDEIKAIVERCTNEFLIRPDWEANISCVDLVNTIISPNVLSEICFLIRRKFGSKQAKIVVMALSLIEALVKNCGALMHGAVNNPSFTKELGNLARKYSNRPGSENKEVSDLVLDIIQAWGEGFLPYQRQFPNLPKLYQDLRREGLPFKAQYDPSRVPIFAATSAGAATGPASLSASSPMRAATGSSSSSSASRADVESDAVLAAVLAASMADFEDESDITEYHTTSSTSHQHRNRGAGSGSSGHRQRERDREQQQQHQSNAAEENISSSQAVDALSTSISLLSEVIVASASAKEVKTNEIAMEMAEQIRHLQSQMGAIIEHDVVHAPENIERLFKVNEEAQQIIGVYDGVARGTCQLSEARVALSAMLARQQEADSSVQSVPPPVQTKASQEDLLGIFDSPPPVPQGHQQQQQQQQQQQYHQQQQQAAPAMIRTASNQPVAYQLPHGTTNNDLLDIFGTANPVTSSAGTTGSSPQRTAYPQQQQQQQAQTQQQHQSHDLLGFESQSSPVANPVAFSHSHGTTTASTSTSAASGSIRPLQPPPSGAPIPILAPPPASASRRMSNSNTASAMGTSPPPPVVPMLAPPTAGPATVRRQSNPTMQALVPPPQHFSQPVAPAHSAASNADPFGNSSSSIDMLMSGPSAAAVDPMDSLLSIASRPNDDFGKTVPNKPNNHANTNDDPFGLF